MTEKNKFVRVNPLPFPAPRLLSDVACSVLLSCVYGLCVEALYSLAFQFVGVISALSPLHFVLTYMAGSSCPRMSERKAVIARPALPGTPPNWGGEHCPTFLPSHNQQIVHRCSELGGAIYLTRGTFGLYSESFSPREKGEEVVDALSAAPYDE